MKEILGMKFIRMAKNIWPGKFNETPIVKFGYPVYAGVDEIKHSHGSDRPWQGCHGRAYTDVLAASHWNDSA